MAATTNDPNSLLRALDSASVQIKKQLPEKRGGAAAEKAYGQAYTDCVRAGVKPALRGRYR